MDERKVTKNIVLENARIIFKNFSGKKTDYNDEGNRNFGVLIPDDIVDDLIADGWKVKFRPPREDDPEHYEQPWLPVKVKFGQYPPEAWMVTRKGRVELNEETIGQLDYARLDGCDIVIRPYNYPALAGRPAGVSAYLKTLYANISEGDFEDKYGSMQIL